MIKVRDYHKLAIIRGEARGHTSSITSKKVYKRKKHKKWVEVKYIISEQFKL